MKSVLRLAILSLLLATAWAGPSVAAADTYRPQVDDDGMYTQPWFLHSFLELGEDLAEAAADGRNFAILWEQAGCPYCKEMHVRNFAVPEVRDYVRDHFVVLQLNLHGQREVTDLDGEVLTEKALARKHGVRFTPTVQFFPAEPEAAAGRAGHEAEVARMPGYLKPFPFLTMFRYVREGAHEHVRFKSYLKAKFLEAVADGRDIESW